MASSENKGGVSYEDSGRDPRLDSIAERRKLLAEATVELEVAQQQVESVKEKLAIAYRELGGMVIPTEGLAYGWQDKDTGTVYQYKSFGEPFRKQLPNRRREIVDANSAGVYVRAPGVELIEVMAFDEIWHAQGAPPDLEI